MRKIRIFLGIALALLVMGLAAIWVLANPNRHRERIQAQLEKQLGRKVTLGEMSLGLLPPRFQVANIEISEDPTISQQTPFVRAEKLDVRIGLLPLLRGSVQMASLELLRPSVELIKTQQGAWNFATIGGGPGAGGAAPPSADGGGEFALNRLTIIDGQIGITDLQRNRPRAGYDHIDLTLLDYVEGKPFSFDLRANIQGQGRQELSLIGDGGPISRGNVADTPFRGKLNLSEVGIEGLLEFLDAKALTNVQGVLSGASDIASQSGAVTSTGKLQLQGARFNNLDIGYPIGFDYNLGANIAGGLVTIDSATLLLGATPLSVSGSLNTAATPLVMDLKLRAGDASIAEIARLASAFGVVFAPGTTVKGRVSADVQAKGPATQPSVRGTVSGRDVVISGQGIPQPVEVKAVDLALSPQAIQSNEFNATSGKTTVVGRFSLLDYASGAPSIDLALRAPGATLPEIQAIAKAYGVTGLDQITGDGTMNFDLRARGPLKSLSSEDATRALNGTVNLDFSPLKVLGFDAAHELGKLGGFALDTADQGATDIVRMVGQIVVRNGVAETDDLRVQLGIGNLSAAGTADLAAEALNLRLSAVFSKEFTEKAGATRAIGLLNAALANSAGELVIPAIVTGSFKQPKFAPDLQAVARMQKQKLLPTLDNPAAAVGNILGVLTGKPREGEPPPAERPQSSPGNTIKGILDLFGGRKAEPRK